MDLINNNSRCRAICITLKVPSTFGSLSYYIIILKTVGTKYDIIYLEPETNLCLSGKLFPNLK